MPAENAQKLAAGLANNYAQVVIRVKPEHMTSYDYSKPGVIQASLASAK
jgi:hypothetical protein